MTILLIIIIALLCVAGAYYIGRVVGIATGFSNAFRMLEISSGLTVENNRTENTPAMKGEGAARADNIKSVNQTSCNWLNS